MQNCNKNVKIFSSDTDLCGKWLRRKRGCDKMRTEKGWNPLSLERAMEMGDCFSCCFEFNLAAFWPCINFASVLYLHTEGRIASESG